MPVGANDIAARANTMTRAVPEYRAFLVRMTRLLDDSARRRTWALSLRAGRILTRRSCEPAHRRRSQPGHDASHCPLPGCNPAIVSPANDPVSEAQVSK